jgi:hypothetical protein
LVTDLGVYEAIALCALLAVVAAAYFLYRRRRV